MFASKATTMYGPVYLMVAVLFLFCNNTIKKTYSGSTPAGTVVRNFLGIGASDSVDFIRWTIKLEKDRYFLQCNFGRGKPNTNGFMYGGKHVTLKGKLEIENNTTVFINSGRKLRMHAINNNLLHIMDSGGHLLVGNEGWSYTLSIDGFQLSDDLNVLPVQIGFKDSMSFTGRTPCLPFDYERRNTNCHKQKWLITLYSDPKLNQPTTYRLKGTVVDHEWKTGKWSISKGKDGRKIYTLRSENNYQLQFIALNNNILLFTDNAGNILTGNADFSFTLNREPGY